MIKRLAISTNFLIALCIFLCSNITIADDIMTKNLGEKAMIQSLRAAIDQDAELNSSPNKIIIGTGSSGCKAFEKAPLKHEVHVLLTWQWLDGLSNINPKTIIVVPEHAIDERIKNLTNKGIKLIPIQGTLHNKTANNLQAAFVGDIDPGTEYILMLAGDTEQEDSSWISYNKAMFTDLLKSLPRDKNILILNGPRTGKHNENTQIIDEAAHKTGTDYITSMIIAENIAKWKIVDFKYGKPSMWDSTLAFCLEHPKTGLILPGESTSMISEALGLGLRPIIYKHLAMTKTSSNYVEQLKEDQRIFNYSDFDYSKRDSYIHHQTPTENQIDKIIKELKIIMRV